MTNDKEKPKSDWWALSSLNAGYKYENENAFGKNTLKITSTLEIDVISSEEKCSLIIENPLIYRVVNGIISDQIYKEFDVIRKNFIRDLPFLYELFDSSLLSSLLMDDEINATYNYKEKLLLRHLSIVLNEQIIDIILNVSSKFTESVSKI